MLATAKIWQNIFTAIFVVFYINYSLIKISYFCAIFILPQLLCLYALAVLIELCSCMLNIRRYRRFIALFVASFRWSKTGVPVSLAALLAACSSAPIQITPKLPGTLPTAPVVITVPRKSHALPPCDCSNQSIQRFIGGNRFY